MRVTWIVALKNYTFFGSILLVVILILTNRLCFAAPFTVTNTNGSGAGSLFQAITDLNSASGTSGSGANLNTITISVTSPSVGAPIVLTQNLPVIRKGVTITSTNPGQIINGASANRLFATYQASLSLANLSLQNGLAQGGGNLGGGGGLGAGGAVYIDLKQALSLNNVSISSCVASGGAGTGTGGPGGGASFSIGSTALYTNPTTGYGGGAGGGGGNGSGGVQFAGGAAGGNSAGSPGVSGGVGGAGGYCGGGGGGGFNIGSGNIAGGSGGGGNGGGAGSAGGGGVVAGPGGAGGAFGNGGAYTGGSGGGGGFGGGGAYGGFGGGGGGGFGGGGGGGGLLSGSTPGAAGRFGGNGSIAGGGGAGIGGAIFVADGGTINVTGTLAIASNSVNGGGGVISGSGVAPDIFLFIAPPASAPALTFSNSADLNATFAIQGDNGAIGSFIDGGISISTTSNAKVTLSAVFVSATAPGNTYQGPTRVTTGILEANGASLPGTYFLSNSGTPGNILVESGATFSLSGGTFPNNTLVNNKIGGIVNVAGAFIPLAASINAGTMNINSGGSFTQPSPYTYTGTINVNTGTAPLSTAITGGSGSILTFGKAAAITYTTGNTISNVPTVNVGDVAFPGTNFTVSNNISNVTTAFNVASGSRVNIGATINGTGGAFTNNGTVFLNSGGAIATTGILTNAGDFNIATPFTAPVGFNNSGALYVIGSGSITNIANITGGTSLNIGQDSTGAANANTFIADGAISGIPLIHVYTNGSSFSSNFTISGLTTGFTVDAGTTATFGGSVTGNGGAFLNNGTMNINSSLNGTGATFTNNNIATLGVGGSITITGVTTNTGTLTLNAAFSPAANSSNSGTIAVSTTGALTIPTGFTNTGGTITTTGAGQLNVSNPLTTGIVTNAGTTNVSSTFTPDAGSGNTGTIAITTNGNFTVPSSFSSAGGTISTAGTGVLTVSNPLSGILINNGITNVSSSLTPASGSSNSNSITVNSPGVLNLNNPFTNTGLITNNGTMHVNADISGTGSITSNNLLNIAANITMTGGTLTNNAILNVYGNRQITAANYISPGSQNFTITDQSVYDSLAVVGVVNVDNGTVNITSNFAGATNVSYSWPILGGSSISHVNTIVNVPAGSLFNNWSHNDFAGNQLIVFHQRSNFSGLADPGVNAIMAAVLDDMSENITNAGQQELINAFAGYTNNADFNFGLQQLVPNINAIAPKIAVSNYTYELIETRFQAAPQAFVDIEDSLLSGVASGSICPDTTFWMAGFGGAANQQATSDTLGYRARALGTMLGLDKQLANDDLYGFGFAFSNTEVRETLNTTSENRMLGYHVLLYGTNYFYGNNFFEWMLTGVKNQNKGGRQIFINNNDFSTNAYFNSWMGGGRINIGKNIDFANLRLSQVNTVQYSYLYQSSYNEVYSPAALHISEIEDNMLTIGSGGRIVWHPDPTAWLYMIPAMHALLTYDVISSAQAVNASFIVGSNNFTILQSPARVALRFGLDLTAEICNRLDFQVSYDLELRSKYIDNSAQLKLLYSF